MGSLCPHPDGRLWRESVGVLPVFGLGWGSFLAAVVRCVGRVPSSEVSWPVLPSCWSPPVSPVSWPFLDPVWVLLAFGRAASPLLCGARGLTWSLGRGTVEGALSEVPGGRGFQCPAQARALPGRRVHAASRPLLLAAWRLLTGPGSCTVRSVPFVPGGPLALPVPFTAPRTLLGAGSPVGLLTSVPARPAAPALQSWEESRCRPAPCLRFFRVLVLGWTVAVPHRLWYYHVLVLWLAWPSFGPGKPLWGGSCVLWTRPTVSQGLLAFPGHSTPRLRGGPFLECPSSCRRRGKQQAPACVRDVLPLTGPELRPQASLRPQQVPGASWSQPVGTGAAEVLRPEERALLHSCLCGQPLGTQHSQAAQMAALWPACGACSRSMPTSWLARDTWVQCYHALRVRASPKAASVGRGRRPVACFAGYLGGGAGGHLSCYVPLGTASPC